MERRGKRGAREEEDSEYWGDGEELRGDREEVGRRGDKGRDKGMEEKRRGEMTGRRKKRRQERRQEEGKEGEERKEGIGERRWRSNGL